MVGQTRGFHVSTKTTSSYRGFSLFAGACSAQKSIWAQRADFVPKKTRKHLLATTSKTSMFGGFTKKIKCFAPCSLGLGIQNWPRIWNQTSTAKIPGISQCPSDGQSSCGQIIKTLRVYKGARRTLEGRLVIKSHQDSSTQLNGLSDCLQYEELIHIHQCVDGIWQNYCQKILFNRHPAA